jgi:hypothetical protein
MQNSIHTILAVTIGSAIVAVPGSAAMPTEAASQNRWTNNSEVNWIGYDLETDLIQVRVKQAGRGPDVRRLRKDRVVTFKFDVDGAAGDKTIVMIDGEEGELAEIPENAIVHIHWKPFGDDPRAYGMFVVKVVYFSEEKLAQRKESAE